MGSVTLGYRFINELVVEMWMVQGCILLCCILLGGLLVSSVTSVGVEDLKQSEREAGLTVI